MAKTTTKIYDSIEVRAQKPLDSRSVVTYREDLYKLDSWPHDSYIDENGEEQHIIYMKEGMIVCVTGDKVNPVFELYILADLSKILNKDYSGWKYIGNMSNGSGPGSGSGPGIGNIVAGNIDGGSALGSYSPSQVIFGGNAYTRGETNDE